jgi:TolC family type I secretion outer membrane protein
MEGKGSARRAGRRVRRALLAALAAAACAPGIPRASGVSLAPRAAERPWTAPRAARVPDSLGATPALPPDLLARATTLGLADVVDLALRNNPATRASWAGARAAAAASGAARGSYWPTVDGVVNAARSDQPAGAAGQSGGAAGAGAGGPRSTYGPSLSLNYQLLDFGGRRGAVATARETAFAAAYTHNRVVQTTVLQVEQAYFGYVGARALRDAQRTSVAEAQASYDAARERDSVGLATVADVLQARTALAQAQLQLQSTEAQLHAARGALAQAIGVSPTAPYDLAGSPEDVPVGEVTASVDSLIDAALRERPDLQAARADAAAARASIKTAHAALLPSLSLAAGDGLTHSSLAPITGRSYAVGLSLQIPLFDGGARQYGVARVRALADAAEAQAATQRRAVITDVYTAYYDLETATQQVRTSDELLASAAAAFRATRARYTGGVGTVVDLLTAQAALAGARAQQAQSRWGWAQSLASLGYAAGALDASGRVAVPVARDTTRTIRP